MKPGRELDALVAEKVMGYCFWVSDDGIYKISVGVPGLDCAVQLFEESDLPLFSTDIAAAFEVVEKLEEEGIFLRLSNVTGHGKWRCCIGHGYLTPFVETASMAICLAALKAKGIEFG